MASKAGISFVVTCQNFCIKIGLLLFGLFLSLIFILGFVVSAPVFVFRYFIGEAAKVFRPDLQGFVSPQGNFFTAELFSQNAPRCSLVVPLVVQGNLQESEAYELFTVMTDKKNPKTGRLLYPEYKQFVEMWYGFAFWKTDASFDIRNHIKIHKPTGNDRVFTPDNLTNVIEELVNKRYKIGRSPWDVNILFNYKDTELSDGTQTVIIMRLHHSLADGYSILYSLIEGLLDVPVSSLAPALPSPIFAKRTKWNELWFKLTFPVRVIHDLANYFVKIVRNNPFNVPDRKKAWKQHYGRINRRVPIQKIKEIKDKLGVTFTSVLLAAVSASMSVVTKMKSDKPIRQASFFLPLPLKEGHPNALTNSVTGAQVDLPMHDFADPTERVRDLDIQLGQQKASTIPLLLYFIANTIGYHFSSVCGIISANRVNVAGLTSFPVGMNNLKLSKNGKEIMELVDVELAAGALVGIAGLAYMALSYKDYIRFSITAETSVLSKHDVELLLDHLVLEIEALYKGVTSNQTS